MVERALKLFWIAKYMFIKLENLISKSSFQSFHSFTTYPLPWAQHEIPFASKLALLWARIEQDTGFATPHWGGHSLE